jgi:hypothetical protein
MATRKIEFSDLTIRVIDVRYQDGKGHRYSKAVDDLSEILGRLKKAKLPLEKSIIDIALGSSAKYQKVGIEKIVTSKQNGIEFYHFRLAFIKRDQADIQVRDLKKGYKPRKLSIGKTEYEYLPLHLTIVPTSNRILLDSKCHTGPSQQFIHKTILDFLDPKKFDYTKRAEVDEHLRVRIVPNKAKKFNEVLTKRLEEISEIGLTFSNPRSSEVTLDKSLDNKLGTKRVNEFIKSLTSKVFGEDYVKNSLADLPMKKIQLKITFDDKAGIKGLKKGLSNNLNELIDSRFVKNSLLVYHDEKTEKTKRVLMDGLVTSYDSTLSDKQFQKSENVWEEHRKTYVLALKDLKEQELVDE